MEHNTTSNTDFNRNSIPLIWGIVAAVVSCILYTVYVRTDAASATVTAYYKAATVVTTLVIYILAGVIQKKKLGGYISLKEAFRAIFIVVLISTVATFVYNIVYVKYVDPGVTERMQAAIVDAMRLAHKSQVEINQELQDQAKQAKEGTGFNSQFLVLAISIVRNSIFGFICAFIIKKEKP